MTGPNYSVEFFDRQFQRQASTDILALNPFEQAALPHLRGRVLDFGCGMGNLAVAAAERGCSVLALDASPAAIRHLQSRAEAASLDIHAIEADLRHYPIVGEFDSIVSIGLLMFFDCPTAVRRLADLRARVRAGGTLIVNVLIDGTTYLDMFAADEYCLFARSEMEQQFADWHIVHSEFSEFAAPDDKIKSFTTLIVQKPLAA